MPVGELSIVTLIVGLKGTRHRSGENRSLRTRKPS